MSSQAQANVRNQETVEEMSCTQGRTCQRRSIDKDHDWQHFTAGAGASMINVIATFPIFKVVFRQQVDGSKLQDALSQLKGEGYRKIYRGLLPPLLQKGVSVSLMFGVYHTFQRDLNQVFPMLPVLVNNSAAAVLAGSCEAILTPFERVQTLLAHRKHYDRFQNTLHTVMELRVYGVKEYYRGFTAILLRNGPSNAIFFGFRNHLKEKLPEAQTSIESIVQDFVCGAVLGATISTMFYPLAVVKMNMQKHVGGEFWGVPQTFRTIFTKRSGRVTLLYRGALMNCSRAVVSWGIINATFEILLSGLRQIGS